MLAIPARLKMPINLQGKSMKSVSSIRIGLLGFGRTGGLVAKEIIQDGTLNLMWVCRKHRPNDINFASQALGYKSEFAPFIMQEELTKDFLAANPIDVLVDFSSSTAIEYYDLIASNGIKIVSAISKYNGEELNLLKKISEKTALLHSPNITLGINWLIIASKVLKKIIPEADIEIIEQHFREKKEVSGTALKIAEQLNLDSSKKVNSIRVGSLVGKHEIIFGLKNQTITLVHESTDRGAFGAGAIYALKWLINKKSGMYSIEEAFHEKFMHQFTNLCQQPVL